jgi:hypothetical protein
MCCTARLDQSRRSNPAESLEDDSAFSLISINNIAALWLWDWRHEVVSHPESLG